MHGGDERLAKFAKRLREMGERGESAYDDVNGEDVVDIPAQAIQGRAGAGGKTFSGRLDLNSGMLRVDCADEPAFWMQINLLEVPALALQPGQTAAAEAVERATQAAVNQSIGVPETLSSSSSSEK